MEGMLVDQENHRSWGLTLSVSQPQQQPPPSLPQSQPPSPTTSPFVYTPLPLPTRRPQQTLIFVPLNPHPLPSMPLHVRQTLLFPKEDEQDIQQHEEEEEEDEEADNDSPPIRQGRERLRAVATRPTKPDIDPPPFPWATSKRATVYTLEHLLSQGLTKISGKVECKGCSVKRDIEFDLVEKFEQVAKFISDNKEKMNDRAPSNWTSPVEFPNCESCGQENGMKPVIGKKKREINWLFLLLGQMIGCCKLTHLKYFCKHTLFHRTGSKDRLLYLTYLGLCKQLHPEGPFDP